MPTTAHIQTIPRQLPLGAWRGRGSGFSETGELTNDGTMGGCWERSMAQEGTMCLPTSLLTKPSTLSRIIAHVSKP
eukprot:415962-Rhodomonas_salina.1